MPWNYTSLLEIKQMLSLTIKKIFFLFVLFSHDFLWLPFEDFFSKKRKHCQVVFNVKEVNEDKIAKKQTCQYQYCT